MIAGQPKNSLPFFEKNLVEELRSIAVPPFNGDRLNWHDAVVESLTSSKKITVTPSGKMNTALKNSNKDLSSLSPEERPAFIAGLGRTVQADAVMNGVIYSKEGYNEIILQVISSKDSRIIWWQAVDVSFRQGALSHSGKQKVLSSILSPFLALAGTKEPRSQQLKQEPVPPSDLSTRTEQPSRTETPPARKPRSKSGKKATRHEEPSPMPDDISPM